MELTWKEYPYKDKTINLTIKEKKIIGLTGNHIEDLLEIILLKGNKTKIEVNGKELKEKDFYPTKSKISFVPQFIEDNIHETTIEEQMIEYMKHNDIYPKNLKKKCKDALKIVGLEESFLKRNIYTCSSSEKKRIQIALELLKNPEIIVLEEPFQVLDIPNKKKIRMVLRRIKDQFEKTIIIVSNNPNMLLQETEELIIFKNDKILAQENTMDCYQRVDFLKKHKIEVPDIIDFVYLAKKNKKAKIDYAKDIRDLIKDIYKHV